MLNRQNFVLSAASSLDAIIPMSYKKAEAAMEPTMSFNVIYPNHDGARFDMRYYRETHIPLVMKVMKPVRAVLIEGVPMGGTAAPYVMIAHFEFASLESMNAALDDPGRAELRADFAKFTDIKPTVMLGRQ